MRVAVLGLGKMGSAIAERLVEAGHDLAVWNRSVPAMAPWVARGAQPLNDGPQSAWDHADFVVSALAGPSAVETVMLGPAGLVSRPASGVLIEMSTIGADLSAQVAAAATQAGIGYVRAPVSGNPSVVRAGKLAIILSGLAETIESCRTVLTDIGPRLFIVGEGEQARVVKLGLNLMLAGTAQLMAEALVLGELGGVGRAAMLETMAGSAIGSPFVSYKSEALIADDYRSTFTTDGLIKDLGLAREAATRGGVSLPVADLTERLLAECAAAGQGDLDFMVLLPRLRALAGLA